MHILLSQVRVHEARFTTPVAGSVHFHTLTVDGKTETKIFTNLYHVVAGKTTSNPWKIYITDILGSNRRRQTCNFLQILYDPDNKVADQILDKGSLHTERLCVARRPPSRQTCIESHSL